MSAAWPLIVDRLVELCPTLPGWDGTTVYDGPPATQETPTAYFTVGYVPGEDFGGSYEQSYELGGLLLEVGTVRCELVVWSGDEEGLPAHRARVFELIDALGDSIRDYPTLGVLPQSSATALAVDPQPLQNSGGSALRATVTVAYTARGL